MDILDADVSFGRLALVPVATEHRATEADSAGRGPGWYDSSFDLHRGLEVREVWPAEQRLAEWIDAFLSGLAATSP